MPKLIPQKNFDPNYTIAEGRALGVLGLTPSYKNKEHIRSSIPYLQRHINGQRTSRHYLLIDVLELRGTTKHPFQTTV